jgi:hypothetical protein
MQYIARNLKIFLIIASVGLFSCLPITKDNDNSATKPFNGQSFGKKYWRYKETNHQYFSGDSILLDTSTFSTGESYVEEIVFRMDSAMSLTYLNDRGCVSIGGYRVIVSPDSLLLETKLLDDVGKYNYSYRILSLDKDATYLLEKSTQITQWGVKLCTYFNTKTRRIQNLAPSCSPDSDQVLVTKKMIKNVFEQIDSSEIRLTKEKVCNICGSDSVILDPVSGKCIIKG